VIDRRRALRGLVLGVWSAFLAWLYLSGEIHRYIGPRTHWVIIFGAASLGAAALAHLLTIKARGIQTPVTMREIGGLTLVVAPLIAVLLVPSAELGSLAASRKSGSGGGLASGVSSFVPPAPSSDRPVSFIDIHFASVSLEYAEASGITDGRSIELVGFVSDSPETDGTFPLTRFYVSCCAADAIPYSAMIAPEEPVSYDKDQWLEVTGTLSLVGERFVIVPSRIEPIPTPDEPYLS
jgi:uncharacterized repeat protein (TIGR03943 family)